jgi:hypothetical protein
VANQEPGNDASTFGPGVLGKALGIRTPGCDLPTDLNNGPCARVRIGVDGMQLVKRGFLGT